MNQKRYYCYWLNQKNQTIDCLGYIMAESYSDARSLFLAYLNKTRIGEYYTEYFGNDSQIVLWENRKVGGATIVDAYVSMAEPYHELVIE